MKLELRIPLRAVTSQNARFGNPHARAAMVKRERRKVRQAWNDRFGQALGPTLLWDHSRLLVEMTRVGPNELDKDNLSGILKAVRDELAAILGVDDRDKRVRFEPRQRSEGRIGRLGIFAVEVVVQDQVCPDCYVEHCKCIHGRQSCSSCAEFEAVGGAL